MTAAKRCFISIGCWGLRFDASFDGGALAGSMAEQVASRSLPKSNVVMTVISGSRRSASVQDNFCHRHLTRLWQIPSLTEVCLAQDLDPALLSRFDASVTFGLPSEECRRQILRQYARHLPEAAVTQLAADAEGMSGRDLRDVAEQAERRWASKARTKPTQSSGF